MASRESEVMFIGELAMLRFASYLSFNGPRRGRCETAFPESSMATSFRTERDSMGELQVPADALWGAQTQRAVQNFPISGLTLPREFIAALGLIKQAAARANLQLGLLEAAVAGAIDAAAGEVAAGRHDRHFPIDVFQTG